MISKKIKQLAKDIKEIKIQGASNIEYKAIEGITNHIKESKLHGKDFEKDVYDNIKHITIQRQNEPKLRNSLSFIFKAVQENNKIEQRQNVLKIIKDYEQKTKEGNEVASENASRMIMNGDVILTHCHSTLVEKTLIKAYKKGISFKVYCTETRPLYQGRITAKNLVDNGLDVTMVVDAGVCEILKKADYFITGADVVTADGSVYNKVGTHAISVVANHYKVSHTIVTTTHICEPQFFNNIARNIEQRDYQEIWKYKPQKLKINNPAFDIIPNNLIDKYITEEGIFSPETLYLWVNKLSK
jgi:ribose 1,5-bisphosphate isomerase